MGYNASKLGEEFVASGEYGRDIHPNFKSRNPYKRRRSSRKKQKSNYALQYEYENWLRSLSQHPDHDDYATSTGVWRKPKDSWHTTLHKKVSSLLNSNKLKQESIVWPEELIKAQRSHRKQLSQPPTVRLSFTTNEDQFDAIKKHVKKSRPIRSKALDKSSHSNHARKRRNVPGHRRLSELESENRFSQEYLNESFKSSSLEERIQSKEHKKAKRKSTVSVSTATCSGHSSGHTSSMEKSIRGRKTSDGRLRKSPNHIRRVNHPSYLNDLNWQYEKYAAQQFDPNAPHTSQFDFEAYYAMADAFQIAGGDEREYTQPVASRTSRVISPTFPRNASSPKLNQIMTEVGEDFKQRFSVSPSVIGTPTTPDYPFHPEDISERLYKKQEGQISIEKAARPSHYQQHSDHYFTHSSNEGETTARTREDAQWNNEHYKEDWRLTHFNSEPEHFFMTRTNELCTKTINEELGKLGYQDVIAEMNESPLYIKHSTPAASRESLLLDAVQQWQIDNSAPSSHRLHQENYSPYMRLEHDNGWEFGRISRKSSSPLVEQGQDPSPESIIFLDNATDKDDLYHQSSEVDDMTMYSAGSLTRSATKFLSDEASLESKISGMVKLMIDEKLGSPPEEPKYRRSRRKHRPRNKRKSGLSTDDVENIIETQLASALAKMMKPRK